MSRCTTTTHPATGQTRATVDVLTDQQLEERLGARLETGMGGVDSPSSSSAELPFGGVECSGFGRELGTLGVDEFANRKLIRIVG